MLDETLIGISAPSADIVTGVNDAQPKTIVTAALQQSTISNFSMRTPRFPGTIQKAAPFVFFRSHRTPAAKNLEKKEENPSARIPKSARTIRDTDP
jgi:hypothetical protein